MHLINFSPKRVLYLAYWFLCS